MENRRTKAAMERRLRAAMAGLWWTSGEEAESAESSTTTAANARDGRTESLRPGILERERSTHTFLTFTPSSYFPQCQSSSFGEGKKVPVCSLT